MRTLLAPAAAAVNGGALALCLLVELDLTLPVRLATCRDTITWGGNDFIGGKQVGISGLKDQGGEVTGMQFQLSGVPSDLLSIALSESIQGKAVDVWVCLMDASTQAILDVVSAWRGTLDQMPITDGGQYSTITVTAEHRGIAFARPKALRYTDGDQQRLYPGDRCLEFIATQAQHQDVWPAAAFFKQ